MPVTVESLMPTMAEAARASGSMLRERFAGATVLRQDGRDIKLDEDKRSEELVLDILLRDSALPIVSEEAGWARERQTENDIYWAVDPLDGSYNFALGIPLCAVSIALCRGFEPLAGGVYDFLRDEWVVSGGGVALSINGMPLKRRPGQRAILASGIPISSTSNHTAVTQLADTAQGWKKLRMIGSAALSLSWVAQGRFDGYREDGIRWWDVAGGLALVRGAGGSIQVQGDRLEDPLVVEASVG